MSRASDPVGRANQRIARDERRALDFYETPAAVTHCLIDRVPQLTSGLILEACNGDHAIAHVLRERGAPLVVTNDLDMAREADFHFDAGDPRLYAAFCARFGKYPDWVISNPPFGAAARIVPNAAQHAQRGVAMLLRMTFMEPVEARKTFHVQHPVQHRFTTQRISFAKINDSTTDSVTTEWMIWTPNNQPIHGVPPHDVVLWKERGR